MLSWQLARQGSLEKLKVLLTCDINPNAADYDARTCMHLAACTGNPNLINVLLDAKADINSTDRWGGTPLRDAVKHGHTEVAALLKDKGGTLGYGEVEASGELCELARQGKIDVIKLMLRCGAQINAADCMLRALELIRVD